MNTTYAHSKRSNQAPRQGTVLFLVVMVILSLSTVSLVSYGLLMTDININGNQVKSSRALYHADAGIKYVKRTVESELETGAALSNILTNLRVTAPTGLVFDPVTNFVTVVEERLFECQVTGRSDKARTTVEVSLLRKTAFQAGIFGNTSVDLNPNIGVRAYDTRINGNPHLSRVPGGSSVGSNGLIIEKPDANMDGSYILGANDAGLIANCVDCSREIIEIGAIDPDPLGINGGQLASEMSEAALVNNNHTSNRIHNERLLIRSHQSGTLTSGDYYLHQFEMKSGSTLNIDSSNGPIRIFITGGLRIWPNANVNYDGLPGDFQLISSSHQDFLLLPKTDFVGTIYAPNAKVRMFPNGEYRGLIWANEAEVKPGGAAYIDIALLDQFLLNELVIQHWKEIRTH